MVEHGRVAVRGPHGLGKTCMESLATLWFSITRDAAGADWKIPTTASVWEQLKNYLWPEIHKWARLLRWDVIGRDPFDVRRELLQWNLKLRFGQAFAISPDDPAHLEGAHADELLYVYDESKAVSDETFDASEGAFSTAGSEDGTNAYALAVSTPGEPVGRFYEIHSRKPGTHDWWVRHVTVEECIQAGRVTAEWVNNRGLLWGTSSAVYKNRVLGEFASASKDGVIPLAWVEAANLRWRAIYAPNGEIQGADRPPEQGTWAVIRPGEKLHTLGVDVALGGEDRTVFALRQGNCLAELRRDSFTDDTTIYSDRIVAIQRTHGEPMAVIDAIGVGAGVFNEVRREGTPCFPFVASAGTKRHDLSGEFGFANCLTGDARVVPIGGLRRVYRARHDGPLIRVKTASGDEFTATPNHHVLTLRGWVPVHALGVGDKLCDAGPRQGRPGSQPEVGDVPAMIGEVYRSARARFGHERVAAGGVDFHGDRPVGDVEVVTIDRPLWGNGEPFGQHRENTTLIRRLLRQCSLTGVSTISEERRARRDGRSDDPSCRPAGPGLAGPGLSAPRAAQTVRLGPSTLRHTPIPQNAVHCPGVHAEAVCDRSGTFPSLVTIHDLLDVDVLEEQTNGLVLPSWVDAVFGQHASWDAPVDPETLRDRVEGLSGEIPFDQVVSVDVVSPGRHGGSWVYTLETSTGAYRTDHTVARNCRSWAWWNLREMLDPTNGMDLAIVPDDILTGDLLAPKYKEVSGARIQVESKDDIRKRIGRSTDDGDAVVQAYSRSGGSWASLYAAAPEEEEDDGVPKPTQKPARSGGWGSVYTPVEGNGTVPDQAPGGITPGGGSTAQSPQGPSRPVPTSGYFAGSAPVAKEPPKSGPIQTVASVLDQRALTRPCRCGNIRADHEGDQHDGACTDPECPCTFFEPPR